MTLATDTSGNNLFHLYFIDIEFDGTTYYISDAYKEHTFEGNVYQPLGELMGVGDIDSGISPSEIRTAVVVSGIADTTDFKTLSLSNKSKGGNVTIRRGLSPTSITDILINDKIYTVFSGFVKNISFAEDFPQFGVDVSDTVIFECSNLWSSRSKFVKNRKTNPEDFNDYTRNTLNYARDPIMDRVSIINGKKFAFGRSA